MLSWVPDVSRIVPEHSIRQLFGTVAVGEKIFRVWGPLTLAALVLTPSSARAGGESEKRVAAPHAVGLPPPPPNVLLIVLDDVGRDKMASFDELNTAPYAPTPRLDALADGGIRFHNVYVNPVCSVTRAAMQTGRYSFRTGMGTVSEVWRLPDSELLLAELLRFGLPPAESYRCGAFGKWHLGDDDPEHAVANGYERFYGFQINVPDHFAWDKIEHDEGSPANSPIPVSAWEPGVIRADSVQWINAQTEPYFAWVCFNAPHQPWQVPPLALLSPATQQELAGLPEGLVAVGNDQRKVFYRAMLEAVDTEIGNLLDGIAPAKLANTMVFVVADNGSEVRVVQPPHNAAHGKPTGYELNIRVPMIVSGPLVAQPVPPGGHSCNALIEAVDIFATVAEITGASTEMAFQHEGLSAPYPEIDGVSFLPLIQQPGGLGQNPWVYSEVFSPSGQNQSPQCLGTQLRAITDGQYKYMKWFQRNPPSVCYPPAYIEEFYRVDVDTEEATNLLLGPLSPEELQILMYLKNQLRSLRPKAGFGHATRPLLPQKALPLPPVSAW